MGAWGHGNFENDAALDFIYFLDRHESISEIESALQAVVNIEGYLDADYASCALAAGEAVALLRGKPAESLPENLIQWHQKHNYSADDALVKQAIQAVEKVLADSELRELWSDAEALFEEWKQAVNELLKRLKSLSA